MSIHEASEKYQSNNPIVGNGIEGFLPVAARAAVAVNAPQVAHHLSQVAQYVDFTAAVEIPGDGDFFDGEAMPAGNIQHFDVK